MTSLVDQSSSSGGPRKGVPEGKRYLMEPRAHKMSLAKASPSGSIAKRGSILSITPLQQDSDGAGASQGKGVSAVGNGSFSLSSKTSQDLTDWNMGAYSPSKELDSEAASYQHDDSYKPLPPQFEDSNLQEPPQGVSDPREQKMSHALAKASPSVSMSKQGSILPLNPLQQGSGGVGAANQEAPQGKGVSAVVDGALQLSSGTSQDLPDWIIQDYSPSYEFDSEVAAFFQQGDGYEALLPQFEVSDLHEAPQGNKGSHALDQAYSSASMSKQGSGGAGAPQGKGVSAVVDDAFQLSSGNSQDLPDWIIQDYSQSKELDSEVVASYQQGDDYKDGPPQFEDSHLQEPPQGVSEPREQKLSHALAKARAYSPSTEYDSEMADFYQQGDGSEVSDIQELPQGANQEALQRKGVSIVGDWSFASSSGNSPSQDQMGWNMGAYSQSDDYDSEMAAFYQQGEGSEVSDMEELPQGVSEPYPPSFIVQTSRGYKRARMSATSNQYSLNQGPEAFSVYLGQLPDDWANYQMPSSTKGSHFKM